MADSKITALTALTAADPANDMIPIVDVSDTPPASGNTKRISINNILACSPSATLASATITGDLTVRTDKLAVRSTGVGIGTTTPNASYILDLTTAYDARARQWIADSSFIGSGNLANGFTIRTLSGTTDGIRFLNYAQTTEFMRIDSSGQVGIGVQPSAWSSGLRAINFSTNGVLYANGGNSAFFGNNYYNDSGGTNRYLTNNVATAYGQVSGAHQWFTAPSGTAGNPISGANAFVQTMTLDASGNLLVGTTSALSAVSGSSQIALGGAGLQTTSQAISAATATTICRSGSGGMAVVGGYNGTGQYSAIIIFSYGGGGGVTVVSSQNNTGSTITYALSGVNVQVTSSLALTNLTTTCIRTA